MMVVQLPVVQYAIDKEDCLLDLNDQWTEFAVSNDAGAKLRPESVIGKPIWDYIRDPDLQTIYQRLIAQVRKHGFEIVFPFRCDSPLFRRYMRMSMSKRDDGSILFVSRTEEIVKRSESEIRVGRAYSGSRIVRQCSMCNLFQLSDKTWGEADQLVLQDNTLAGNAQPSLIWGVCEPCRTRMKQVHEERFGRAEKAD
ncbi:PAS domain-containing protein [Stieleria sp. JC731]|uniref:PAS domain-containing protein n=1 Tax=Pirellulaceae TaxID=2691357 RepID=UPI001E3B6514|nr:PAS domain-containing protein [Stieleria sp. JC731]MCC9603240.1 PAS domain-containing protein [Stieleria sp. JC731]